jgi:monovalent cation/hydrogen antiporter
MAQYSAAGIMGTMQVIILGLLAFIAGLAWLGRKLPVPYPIVLVLGGLLLSLVPGFPSLTLSPELVFFIFLPPLLYPAALFTSWRDFQANLRPILLLAIGLVLFTTLVVGYVAHRLIPDLSLAAAVVLGAIVSPPDAIAASAVAERLRVPHRIVTILEGESLVNDATALVAYRFAVAAVVTGFVSWGAITAQFFLATLGGIFIGLLVGTMAAWIQRRIDDPPIEITIGLLTPFVAYLPAERLGLSGVLAVVTAGLHHGWRLPELTSSRTRLQAGPVWEMIEFLLNGFVFILIGLQLPTVVRALAGHSKLQLVGYAAAVSLAVILVRLLWIFPAAYLPRRLFPSLRRRDPYPDWRHVALIGWTGMRGVVSLAAALALPLTTRSGAPFPGRDLILFLTFAVILATLVLQGLSLPPLIRWLGIEDDRAVEKEESEARLQANEAALARLDELARSESIKPDALHRLRAEYLERVEVLSEECARESGGSPNRLFSSDYERLAREALQVERATLLRLRNQRIINDEVLRRIQRDVDLAEARLRRPPAS